MSIPSITYGVALFTDDAGEIKAMFDALKAHGVTRLDTARIYVWIVHVSLYLSVY